jgi:flagellar motor switch protein FliN
VTPTLEWLVAQWTLHFSEITLTMSDVQPEMHVAQVENFPVDSGLLWWEQPFSCAPHAPIWTGAREETWMEMGKIVLAAAGVDPAPISEVQSTYIEIVRQSMASLASDIGHRMSAKVTASKGAETAPRKINQRCFRIEAKLPEQTVELYFIVADELCDMISSAIVPSNPAHQPSIKEHQGPSMEQAMAPGSRTFELLLDVELPVSISFGRAAIKLQDAIKLITGSLIELDRGLSDPVELLVNNFVIARGEVVVIEGNYGVRITEIVSHKERIQQTRRYMLQ